ncbi:MAG: AtrD, ABC-transporter [Lentinula lateritia]|uniref:ABC-2 type transporter-domain-containing protein n=1 Tax=Lentinula lateritia TaxID=40482 RepID=A0ABQ8V6G0_9AGAR|nr:MAG: AtrD, ABC-transporter [Lentinula lateritia]KAJ4471175.1 ABC-2 type transporter-domain-containing protein [Lentinula lateritia]
MASEKWALGHSNASSNNSHADAATLEGSQAEHVVQLARTVTKMSMKNVHTDDHNPFIGTPDESLNPLSGKFDYKKWIHSILAITSRDPERYPTRTAGISFTNLNVHGYGSAADHQKTVGNVLLDVPSMIAGFFGRKGKRVDILRDFEGVVRQGEMLVVLGPPGSGCTTLLKTISGETHGFYVGKEAKLNYQGIPWETMHKDFRGEVVYNAETDVHFPNLTVGQTLSFAARARTPRARLPGVTREQWAEHMRDVVMAVFGLTHTINTRVGNEFIRGVSGGERKRVSIAEVALSGAPLQCWDNSTRGLDSATALEFVKTVNMSAKYMGSTAVIAIYQASQSIYDIFDKVTVLYEGRQIYFGRTEDAKKFFVDMGFQCPDRQTTADFLTSLTNPAERQARPGFESRVPHTPDEFARMWKESAERRHLLQEIEEFNNEFPVGGSHVEKFRQSRKSVQAKGLGSKSPYTLSVPMQIQLCLSRGFQRLRGDMSLFFTSVLGNFFFSLIISSIFYNLPADTSSFYSRGALLFYAILMNAFSSVLEILTLYEQRPIVEKHSRMALYHPFVEAVSAMICDLPAKILTAISFNLVLYFMTNLRRTPAHFFIFLLFSFACTLTMSMIFRTIGATSRTISQAMAPAAIIMLGLIIYTGFTIPISDMHPWFRWINYINPIAYAFESLMLNEFFGREFPCITFIPSGPGYADITGPERICATTGAEAGSSVVEGASYLSASFNYYHSHMWRNLGIIFAFMVFFLATALVATEYITAAKSKGEVLVFRRGHIPVQESKSSDDEESAQPVQQLVVDVDEKVKRASAVSGLQKQTSIFHWEDVCYDIKIKGEGRRLLDNVDGWVEPGTLTALMGASGAGKTTLLDTLASRVTMGVVTGNMFVDGQQRDESFQRKTGYVQQQDLHLQTSTVREALIFSARLRQPQDVPDAEKVAYCSEVIRLLGMEKYADAVVGVPGEGLNVEQRKRLTIGVELAAKPKLLLFLDEPTSGLDSQTAWSICTLLRDLANNGQAILCTIHQPSALLFQEFDRLLFLARGGRTVYFGDIGENSKTLTSYFERQGASPCPPDANPAEWMLQVIGAAPGAVADRDYADAWRQSDDYIAMKKELSKKRELSQSRPQPSAQEKRKSKDYSAFSASFQKQFQLCLYRVFQQLYRTPSYIYSKTFLSVTTSLFIGFTFYKADNTLQGLQNQMFSVFMLMTIFGNLVNQIMPHFVTQRSLYEVRERPSKTYSWMAFMLANICAELPWNTLMSVFIFFGWYYPIGLYRNAEPTGAVTERGALLFLLIWSFLMFTSTFTHMIIASVDVAENGGNIATLLFSLTILFCGVLVSPSKLPGFWIFMYRVSPFTYLVDAMLSVSLANAPAFCSSVEVSVFDPPSGQTCGQYLSAYMSIAGGSLSDVNATSQCEFCAITDTNAFLSQVNSFYDHRWRNFGLMWAYVAFNVCAALFLYWFGRVPKSAKKN